MADTDIGRTLELGHGGVVESTGSRIGDDLQLFGNTGSVTLSRNAVGSDNRGDGAKER